ncbi:MAG: hypothetical protein HS130_01135 [Deltaproteobacteria bacterium]|nr:hypothetical protein [Deltaproteobacteria bacterium]MCL4873811.1 hypothetical protein [bacterium]
MPSFCKNVFINCPFDKEYKPLLNALLFTIIDCGFKPRVASEISDSGDIRVAKINRLIRESCFSIHDICRIEPSIGKLPRFNMPFELGLDFGCKFHGPRKFKRKKFLILEEKRFRYQKVISDISGYDIKAHSNNPQILVEKVRHWILDTAVSPRKLNIPAPKRIWQRLNDFYSHFEIATKKAGYSRKHVRDIPVKEFVGYITDWKKLNPIHYES